MKNIRSGDVGLKKINKIAGEKLEHNGEYILALGETTGHAHRLKVENPNDMEIYRNEKGGIVINLKSEGILSHEEHKTLVVPKGIYKQVMEREYDHFAHIARQVVD